MSITLIFHPPPLSAGAPAGQINHVVVMWLKRPGNSYDRTRLVRASEKFREIPGVVRIETGRSLPVHRPGVEQAFDLCVILTFKDQTALTRFETDPRHLQAVRSVLRPLVQRYIVFNSVAD